MDENDQVRSQVSRSYAKAVTSGGSCCGRPEPKGVAAALAGYDPADLAALPDDAVVNSFGCGNPVAFSEIKEGETVVDLGSGAGIDLLLAARKVGPTGHVIGIDMTDEMIERARANIAAAGLINVEVRKGIIEDLPIASGTVDWVISNCVINLSPEKDRVFAEIVRVLKPGGHMMVSDMMAQDLPDWIRQNAAMFSSCIGGAISEDAYLAGLRKAGMAEAEVKERLIYDADQLASLALSEESLGSSCGCGCSGSIPPQVYTLVAQQVAGKIWSAKVKARKG